MYTLNQTDPVLKRSALRLDTRLMPRQLAGDWQSLVYSEPLLGAAAAADFIQAAYDSGVVAKAKPSRVFGAGLVSTTATSSRASFNLNTQFPAMTQLRQQITGAIARSAPFFGASGQQCDVVDDQLLMYKTGGHFVPHCDNSIKTRDAQGNITGFVQNTPQRQLVGLLFLSTQGIDFDGGELVFTTIVDNAGEPLTIKPEAGVLLVFPAHLWYMHGVNAVTSGTRFVVNSWRKVLPDFVPDKATP
jgi:predicted 2-oxoglutarate/Fe(II)-dependent dioxygenase YbiX